MPVLNPPSSPQKILVEVPLPQPVGGTTTPSRPAASPTPASVPRPKKPKPDPFKQIKGPPVMILPHAMEQGVEKMQRGGKAIKMERSDHEAMQRNIVGSFQWAGSKKPEMAGHDPVALSVYADMLEEMGHPAATIFQHAADPERQQQGEKVGMSGMFVSPAKAPVDESGVSLSIGRGRKTKQNPSHPIWLHAGFQVDGKYGRVHSVVTPEEAMDIADKVDHFYAGKHPIAAEIRSAAGRHIKAKKKMQREGQSVKFAADRETLASLARGVQDSLFHGIDHAITPTRILADYLRDHGHDNLSDHLMEVAKKLDDSKGQDHPHVWIAANPTINNTPALHRILRDDDMLMRVTTIRHSGEGKGIPIGVNFVTRHPQEDRKDFHQAQQHAAKETESINSASQSPTRMGRFRAPAGGMIVRGQFYPGGKMLPKEATEANPQPNKKTDAKANRKKKKKKKRKKKAIWPTYPMGYRGPFNDDDEEGGDGGGEAMRRKGKPSKFSKEAATPPIIPKITLKDPTKLIDKAHQLGTFTLPLAPDHPLAKHFVPDGHNFSFIPDPLDGGSGVHVRLSSADPHSDHDGKNGLIASVYSRLPQGIMDGYARGWNAKADERREFVGMPPTTPIPGGLFGDPLAAHGYADADNHRPPGHSIHTDLSGDSHIDTDHIFGDNSSFGSEVHQLGGGLFQDSLSNAYTRLFGGQSGQLASSSYPVMRKTFLPLWHAYLAKHPEAKLEDLAHLVSRVHNNADQWGTGERLNKLLNEAHPFYRSARDGGTIRRLAMTGVDKERMTDDHAAALREELLRRGVLEESPSKHARGKPIKFAAEPSYPMYPEGTPPVHSIEVKDRKKFGDTLFNKHQGKPVPLNHESKLAKLHDPYSHNLVAFKDAETGEHFLHGRLSEAGGQVHLNPTPMKDEWAKAYDYGYSGHKVKPGTEGTLEHHLQRLGSSDATNFRPHGHSIRQQASPELDLQDQHVDEYMRYGHEFFVNTGRYDPHGRINVGDALRSIFNEHLKRGEEKPFTELADHAAQALYAEHADPEDGISQNFNTAKKMSEEVGKGNPTNDPDLESQAWKAHIQAMIDKHLPDSGWASKKQGQGKEKMRRGLVKMAREDYDAINRQLFDNGGDGDTVTPLVHADMLDEEGQHAIADFIRDHVVSFGRGPNQTNLPSGWEVAAKSHPSNSFVKVSTGRDTGDSAAELVHHVMLYQPAGETGKGLRYSKVVRGDDVMKTLRSLDFIPGTSEALQEMREVNGYK